MYENHLCVRTMSFFPAKLELLLLLLLLIYTYDVIFAAKFESLLLLFI